MRKSVLLFFIWLISSQINLYAQDSLWNIHTCDYHGTYYGTVVGNGGIGILPWKEPFSVRQVVLNHVFDTAAPQEVSRLVRGINPFCLNMKVNGRAVDGTHISGWEQCIHMKEAIHQTRFVHDGKLEVSYRVCALRSMPYAGLIQVDVKALGDVYLSVENWADVPEEYKQASVRQTGVQDNGHHLKMLRTWALTKHRNLQVAATSAFIFENEAGVEQFYNGRSVFTKSLKKGEKFSFALLGAICTERDFIDPFNESDREVIYGAKEGVGKLMELHLEQWNDMWQGDIQIVGDDEAQRAVRFALYHLYSSARLGSRLSIPPFGLTSQGYNGHIFWDTEFWMFPPMLFLNQGIARSMMDYRTDRLKPACQRAFSYGYRGAMFPWESDDAGEEACPTSALTGPFEHHITADIAIAAWNYYCMSRDLRWLREDGFPLMEQVAEFWVSRAELNDDGSYSIRNVVCADEYAEGVDDNAFTNAAAKCALQDASKAAVLCGMKAPASWNAVARGLRILKSSDGVTREYEGYNGQGIKQADANLLAYPLKVVTRSEDIRKDLLYYEPKIDKNGPAMSYSVLALQYARLGDGEKAYELFVRSFRPNQLPPFGVISEGAGGTNPYFTTGAGGLLQMVINGFCGLDLTDNGVRQLPSALPKHWKKVIVTGIGPSRKTFTREQ